MNFQKKIFISLLAISLFIVPLHSQNFVPNCIFDNYFYLPYDRGQLDRCENWYSPGGGTPDYCNDLSSSYICGIPVNLWGDQPADDGIGYTHIICYYPHQDQWEYIQTKLACDLIAGETYNVSFMVSCSDRSRYAIDGMGLQFSADSLLQNYKNIISIPEPHISNTPGSTLIDKTGWMEISGQYVASGDEEYITIGNFIENSNLQIHIFPVTSNQLLLASYYIDNVSIVPVTPMLNLGNDTIICPQDSLILDASMPCATAYSWNNGLTDSIITISTPGNYQVEVEIGCGSIVDNIDIQHFQFPDIPLPNDTSICVGADIILDAGTGFNSYLWQDNSNNQYYTADSAGLYWVEIEDTTNCVVRDSVNIGMITTPFFQLGNDTILCFDDSITLVANITGPYLEYLWSDFSTDQELFVSDSGNYWLQVSNPCGANTDSIQIDYINCITRIFLPNAFTPNGDGKNDIFMPIAGNIDNYRMYIFDRWGKQIFESVSLSTGWDGTNNGSQCPMGTYVWVIQYQEQYSTTEQKTETIKGTITLLR